MMRNVKPVSQETMQRRPRPLQPPIKPLREAPPTSHLAIDVSVLQIRAPDSTAKKHERNDDAARNLPQQKHHIEVNSQAPGLAGSSGQIRDMFWSSSEPHRGGN